MRRQATSDPIHGSRRVGSVPASGRSGARAGVLAEPTTTLTDYALAVLAGILAVSLLRHGAASGDAAMAAWGAAFAATAGAALTGGTVHGFAPRLGEAVKQRLWQAALILAGLSAFFLLAGVALALETRSLRTGLLVLAVLKLGVAFVATGRTGDFRYVVLDTGASLLLILVFELYRLGRGDTEGGAVWIVAGAVLSLLAAMIQQRKIGLHRHFNHNDLFHVLQIVASYLLYRGAFHL